MFFPRPFDAFANRYSATDIIADAERDTVERFFASAGPAGNQYGWVVLSNMGANRCG
jgi:hypothetical protein